MQHDEKPGNNKIDTSKFDSLPDEVIWETVQAMPPSTLLMLRATSSRYKNIVESFLNSVWNHPERLMKLVSELPSKEAAILLSYYCNTVHSLPTREKPFVELIQKPLSEMTPMEVCCYALIRGPHDKIEGLHNQLEAISTSEDFKNFNPSIQNSFKITSLGLEISDNNNKNEYHIIKVAKFGKQLELQENVCFMNLSGLNLKNIEIDMLEESVDWQTRRNDFNINNFNPSKGNLSNVNLSGTNLSNASIIGLNLTNANLKDTDLSDALLGGVILTNADLSNSNLTNTNFVKSRLTNANLSHATLSDTEFGAAYHIGGLTQDSTSHNSNLNGLILLSLPKDTASMSIDDLAEHLIAQLNKIEPQVKGEDKLSEGVKRKEDLRKLLVGNVVRIVREIHYADKTPDYHKQLELLDKLIERRHPVFAEEERLNLLRKAEASATGFFSRMWSKTASESELAINNPSTREKALIEFRNEIKKKMEESENLTAKEESGEKERPSQKS